jgi:hypothetical protein
MEWVEVLMERRLLDLGAWSSAAILEERFQHGL